MSSNAGFGSFPFPASPSTSTSSPSMGAGRGVQQQIPPQTQQPVIQPPTAQQLAQHQHQHQQHQQHHSAPVAAAAAEGGADAAAGAEGEVEELVVRLVVPNSSVGSIIGKAGSAIKDLTAQTGAKIHIAQNDEGSYERTITISGAPANVATAQAQITSRVHEDSFAEVKDVESPLPLDQRVSLHPIKLLVPNVVVGRLIGKSGINLKKTMAETNTFISCAKDDELTRFAVERVVSIVGKIHDQNKALTALALQANKYQSQAGEQVAFDVNVNYTAAPRAGFSNFPFQQQQQQPQQGGRQGNRGGVRPSQEIQDQEEGITLYVPNNIVGSIATVKEIASRSKTQIRVFRTDEIDPSSPLRPISVIGTIEAIFKAEAMLFAKVLEAPPAVSGGHELRVELVIPNETVGRVIGKKGSQVKKINETSGARVTVNQEEEPDDSPGTVVSIVGGLESNLFAQNRVFEIVYYQQPPSEQEQ